MRREAPEHISLEAMLANNPPKTGYKAYPSPLPYAGLSSLKRPHSPKDRKTPKRPVLHKYLHTQTIKTLILHTQSGKMVTLNIQLRRYRPSTPRLRTHTVEFN